MQFLPGLYEEDHEKIYFTLTGTNYYHGKKFLKSGMKVKLVKEPYITNSVNKNHISNGSQRGDYAD